MSDLDIVMETIRTTLQEACAIVDTFGVALDEELYNRCEHLLKSGCGIDRIRELVSSFPEEYQEAMTEVLKALERRYPLASGAGDGVDLTDEEFPVRAPRPNLAGAVGVDIP
ncbi:hypothetical protein HRbin16_01690 [bacterium HR16]|nr:hypothetical protein HRbin16_01690 [bacterium HR16]